MLFSSGKSDIENCKEKLKDKTNEELEIIKMESLLYFLGISINMS